MAEFAQLTLIKDDERKTRDVMREHFAGLRERAVADRNFDMMSDAERLGTILSLVRSGGVADPLTTAEKLIETFGSVKGAIEARPEQLAMVPGMTAARVEMISLIVPLVRMWHSFTAAELDGISNSRQAEEYCLTKLAGERVENFLVICLNAKCKILGVRRVSVGSISEVSAYPRIVTEAALNYNAHSVILTHNHPGGTCAPSTEDISSTLQIQRVLNSIGIMLMDHIIVAGDRTYSMVQHGDIDYKVKRL